MNIHVRACVQSVHHQHAHMISDGHASIGDFPVKVKTSLHQEFSQVANVMNLCFIQNVIKFSIILTLFLQYDHATK